MHLGFVIKKTLTLLALVDPFMAIPLFVCATAGLDVRFRDKYSRQLGITVALSLLIGGLFGLHLLDFMGVSLASIQIGGGAIMFIVSLAMVVAKEETIKYTPRESEEAAAGPSHRSAGDSLTGRAGSSFLCHGNLTDNPAGRFVVCYSAAGCCRDRYLAVFPVCRAGRAYSHSFGTEGHRTAGRFSVDSDFRGNDGIRIPACFSGTVHLSGQAGLL